MVSRENSVVYNKLAFGCSHTYGTGVDEHETWPYKLGAMNFGVPGSSCDYIARVLPEHLAKYNPMVVYVLWPDWTRFEYNKDGAIHTSVPADSNRIYFMEVATEEWLLGNYQKQQSIVRELCKDIKLVEMTLEDLTPYIDHADKWPLAKDNAHFSEEWHNWVAEIYAGKT